MISDSIENKEQEATFALAIDRLQTVVSEMLVEGLPLTSIVFGLAEFTASNALLIGGANSLDYCMKIQKNILNKWRKAFSENGVKGQVLTDSVSAEVFYKRKNDSDFILNKISKL